MPAERYRALRIAARAARERGAPLYLIGGSVRDLLLGAPSPDLDLCVVGDGIAFARALATELGAPVSEDPRFLTAKIAAAGGAIDIATARRETYPHPGALPRVAPGSIEDDLARRDFSVNAMAVRLDRGPRRLLDPYDGTRDLGRRRLRVLYPRSFVDDPTRILRAARYAARLGFKLERGARDFAVEAVRGGCLDTVSGDRIRRELMLLLQEPAAWRGLRLCAEVGALAALGGSVGIEPRTREHLRRAGELCAWFSRRPGGANLNCALVRLLVIADRLSEREGRALVERLRLTAPQRQALAGHLACGRRARRVLSAPKLRNSRLAGALVGLPLEAAVALAATSSPRVRRRCKLFLEKLRGAGARIRGEDLARLGFEPGPAWGRALAAARDARLDGRARTKEDELRLAQRVLRSAARGGGRRA